MPDSVPSIGPRNLLANHRRLTKVLYYSNNRKGAKQQAEEYQ